MPLSNAERQKKYKERKKIDGTYLEFKLKHAAEQKRYAQRVKEKEKLLPSLLQKKEQAKRRTATKKRVAEYRKRQKHSTDTPNLSSEGSPVFSSAVAFAKATARLRRALPSSPKKRKALCKRLFHTEVNNAIDTPAKESTGPTALSTETVEAVTSFYERDDISRQAPGRKDFTIITQNGQKTRKQTKYLTLSILEIYSLFKEEYPNLKMGKSKFADLRPKHVLPSAKTPLNVCLGKYHENFILAASSLHRCSREFPEYSSTLPEQLLCKPAERDCWLNNCSQCKNRQVFMGMCDIVNTDVDLDTPVSWYIWKGNSEQRIAKVEEHGTVEDLQQYILSILPQFLEHVYIKRQQSFAYQKERKAAESPSASCLLQIDFAENFTCFAQDEIQSAHWEHNQISLFTASMWFDCIQHPYVIVSDNLTHSKDTVVAYLDRLLDELPDNIKTVSIWSDGARSQFKNRYIMAVLKVLETKHDVTICWNFFATSHGKGPVDGIGGALKRNVWLKIKARSAIVNDALSFVAASSVDNVNLIHLTSEAIENRNQELNLNDIFKCAPAVIGISEMHRARIEFGSYLSTYMLTLDDDGQVRTLVEETDATTITADETEDVYKDSNYQQGDWCLVNYDNQLYPGEILEIRSDQYRVNCMAKTGSHSNTFQWPAYKDCIWYEKGKLKQKLHKPVPTNSRGHYKFLYNYQNI